jgi:8-oxo-dGTP diphosphatase / 2-hydroxy-dATP diphosphatase
MVSFQEESGLVIYESSLKHAGVLFFLTEGIDWAFHIDIYRLENYEGEPQE